MYRRGLSCEWALSLTQMPAMTLSTGKLRKRPIYVNYDDVLEKYTKVGNFSVKFENAREILKMTDF